MGFESRALALTTELHWQTTAHSLAYALILLALHPDEQERLYAHTTSVLPDGRSPVRPLYTTCCYFVSLSGAGPVHTEY